MFHCNMALLARIRHVCRVRTNVQIRVCVFGRHHRDDRVLRSTEKPVGGRDQQLEVTGSGGIKPSRGVVTLRADGVGEENRRVRSPDALFVERYRTSWKAPPRSLPWTVSSIGTFGCWSNRRLGECRPAQCAELGVDDGARGCQSWRKKRALNGVRPWEVSVGGVGDGSFGGWRLHSVRRARGSVRLANRTGAH